MLHKMAVLSSDGRGCHPGEGRGRGETRPYFLQCGAAGGSSLGKGGLSGEVKVGCIGSGSWLEEPRGVAENDGMMPAESFLSIIWEDLSIM